MRRHRDSDSIRRGRPKTDESLKTGIRISEELKEVLDIERRRHERYNDTILRLFRERTYKISILQRRVDELEKTAILTIDQN